MYTSRKDKAEGLLFQITLGYVILNSNFEMLLWSVYTWMVGLDCKALSICTV